MEASPVRGLCGDAPRQDGGAAREPADSRALRTAWADLAFHLRTRGRWRPRHFGTERQAALIPHGSVTRLQDRAASPPPFVRETFILKHRTATLRSQWLIKPKGPSPGSVFSSEFPVPAEGNLLNLFF